MSRVGSWLALGLLAGCVVACGDDEASTSGSGGSPSSTASTASTATATNTSGAGAGASSSGTASGATTTSTAGSGGAGQGGGSLTCGACGEPSDAGAVENAAITELSGLAASRLHDDVVYAHNDSGDGARFFALTLAGEDRGTFTVSNATAVDWEEIAAGPCGDGAPGCLYIADFGDNDEVRDDLVLYRVGEPADVGAGLELDVEAEAFPFSYPDGPHNAEAFVVHPTTGVVTIFTKGATSFVFELVPPLTPGMVATAAGEIAFDSFIPLATAADVTPDGRTLAVRTYADVLFFPIAEGASVASAIASPSCAAPHAAETQGEALAFLTGGTSFVTASEGAASTLGVVDCP